MNKKILHHLSGPLLVVVSTMVALLFAEMYVRLFHKELVDTAILQSRLDETSIKALVQPSENPDIFYELRPNLDTHFLNSQVITSREGYRISARQAQTPHSQDAIRMAVLGDSTSFGWGVEYEDTYPELTRAELEQYAGVPIEVRNYSVPGYNSRQELYTFLDKVKSWKPDLLIVHRDHNDAEPTGLGYPPTYIPPGYGDNALHSSLLKLMLRQIREYRLRSRPKLEGDEHNYFGGYIMGGPSYDDNVLALRTLSGETRTLNIPSIVILFNAFVKVDDEYHVLHEKVANDLEGTGLYMLDLYPLYQTKLEELGWSSLRNVWLSKDPVDGHPNPTGHRLIADMLVDKILSEPDLVGVLRGGMQ